MLRSLPLLLIVLLAGSDRPVQAQSADSTLTARYRLAESYMAAAQFDRAIGLLEDLVARDPSSVVFTTRLKEALEQVKRYDEAIGLLERGLATSPSPAVVLADIGRLRFLKGDEQAAHESWEAALGAEPLQPGLYLIVYRTLMQLRLFERAVDVLERGRTALGSRELFRIDLAFLYGIVGRYDDAMAEYLALLIQNERQIGLVRSRLESVVEQPDALDAALAATERGVRTEPLNRSIRELLGWLYMEAGRYQDALNAYRAIDRLEQMQGQILYGFALQALDAAAYDPARTAFEEILDRYPDAPAAADAQAALGTLFERRAAQATSHGTDADWRLAVEAYAKFLDGYPGHPLQADVRYKVARIRLDALFELDQAQFDLERLVQLFPGAQAADQAAFDLGRLDVLRGRLDASRVHFTRLADRLRTGELAEAARLELALLHYYRGEFDAARAMAESMKENTAADVSNDAIRLKVDLVEHRGPDSLDTALRAFAHVQLLERQRKSLEALSSLDTLLAGLGDHALLDDALYLRATLLDETGRSDEAVAAFLEFPLVHPDSPLSDRALFAAAELESRRGRTEEAIAAYTRLLETAPGSLLATEARARVRRLRGDGV